MKLTHKFVIRLDAPQNQSNTLRRDQLHPLFRVLRIHGREVARPIAASRFGVAGVHDIIHMTY